MSSIVFRYLESNNKIILTDSNTNLLYLVTIPEKIYCELTKKENKNKRKSTIDVSTINPDIKPILCQRLIHTNYKSEFNDIVWNWNDDLSNASLSFTIKFVFLYENDIYREQRYTIELTATFIEDYSTLPIQIFESLSMLDLYKQINLKNKMLEEKIKSLEKRIIENSFTYNSYDES